MKMSIRKKIFILITGLITFFVILSWVLNNKFLVQFYFYNKKNALLSDFNTINNAYNGNLDEVDLQLEKMERMEGRHIIIEDTSLTIKYDSSPKRFMIPDKPFINQDRQNVINSILEEYKIDELEKGKIVIKRTTNSKLKSDFINLIGRLKNGDYIYIGTPVAAIEESVDISNKFFVITGIVTIITGIVVVFILSGKFTKPILELNKIAQKMSYLDFTEKYIVKTSDEIGELGESINSLSNQLEKSITDLISANEKLKEDIEKERKIDEMRKEFISSVSHELKTPIALIQGYAEGLRVNVNQDEDNKNFYCEVIEDEAAKMNRLVKQLLDLSQIESGGVQIEKSNFNITQIVEEVIRKNSLIFKQKNINIMLEKERDYLVNGDVYRAEQIITNYVNNAINHVCKNKIIKVIIKEVESKVRVLIYNSGAHISEEEKEKIWHSFYKVDKARTREYGGTGLGLSIVRAIQEAHKNNYGVENVHNGVEFWFDLDKVE